MTLLLGTILPEKGFGIISTWSDSGTVLINNVTIFYQNTANYNLSPETDAVDVTVMKRARVEAPPDSQVTSKAQGETVYFNHILRNIGNAPDTFYFTYASSNGWDLSIIDDLNQDGIHQANETTTLSVTPLINKNDTYSFFVSVYVPLNAYDGQIDTVTVNVISGYIYPDTYTIYDTVLVDSKPNAPTNVSAEFIDTYIRIIWTPPVDTDIVGYNIYKSTNGGAYSQINTSTITDTQYIDTDLVYPNNYYYKVCAVDNIQEGLFSDSASAPLLSLTKTANVTDTQPGYYVTYTLGIENIGYAPATNIILQDTIPAYTDFDTATQNSPTDTILYSQDGAVWEPSPDTITVNYVKWQSGIDLNSGDTAEFTLKVRIKW